MTEALDHHKLYRLPWSLPDNAIGWLEPTAKCNLACLGCYRANVNEHKSLDAVAADLDVFQRYRAVDGISIAGGDPLTHPEIVDIVRMVAERGWKPILKRKNRIRSSGSSQPGWVLEGASTATWGRS